MGIRELNRKIQDFLRPKRLAFGRFLWDRKNNNSSFLCFLFKKEKPRLEEENRKKQRSEIRDQNLIKEEKIKSILFIRNDGKIGDMIVNTLMFREIKKVYPEVKIGVVTRGANKQVIVNNPHVDKIYDYSKNNSELKKLTKEIASEKYDLLIDFSEMLRVKQMKFINLCKAKINMGLNKADWKLFDVSVEYNRMDQHITQRYKKYLEILGIKNPNLAYDIHLSKNEEEFGKEFRKRIKEKKLVCVNPYGASKHRTLNEEKIKEIVEVVLEKEDTAITFVYSSENREAIKRLCVSYKERVYFNHKLKTLGETMAIIKYSDLIISPDTSIIHIGVGFDKKIIGIYRGHEGQKYQAWGPGSTKASIVYTPERDENQEELGVSEFNIEKLKSLL